MKPRWLIFPATVVLLAGLMNISASGSESECEKQCSFLYMEVENKCAWGRPSREEIKKAATEREHLWLKWKAARCQEAWRRDGSRYWAANVETEAGDSFDASTQELCERALSRHVAALKAPLETYSRLLRRHDICADNEKECMKHCRK